jgi:hypothetical protein
MLHLHSYAFDTEVHLHSYAFDSVGSLFIIYCSILGLIQKCSSMIYRCLIELVV